MNRKAFLSSIAALISIPFLGKSKEKEHEFIIRPDDANPPKWVKANPVLLNDEIVIRGEDLFLIINKNRYPGKEWK